jgi:excisionase family DNA binding protein
MQKLEKLLYTTAEARAVIGCGTTRLYELLAAGKLRARRLGHRSMIEAESLRELVDSLPRVTTPTMRHRASSDAETKPAA